MQLFFFPVALAAFPLMADPAPPAPTPGSDEALMLAYARGDAGAFETLYGRHKGGVYRYFVRSLREPGLADELFQDVWASLVKARATYTVEAKFSTWLYRLAHNRLIDHYRRAQLVQFVPVDGAEEEGELLDWPASEAPGPEVQVASRQAAAQLKKLVEALPPAQREAFLLQAEGGLSLEAIAEATGTGRETVKSRLRYAFDKLRAGMKDHL
ncbi:MAG TPA: RNA polymerase sigma factor [Burkholderiales bacterium]|nr:RNA polymerase sigma factor [Burkholderiales bacterium]